MLKEGTEGTLQEEGSSLPGSKCDNLILLASGAWSIRDVCVCVHEYLVIVFPNQTPS